MVLEDTQIEKRIDADQLLKDHDVKNIRNCGYILRIGKVFRPETGREELLNATGNLRARVWEIGPSETLVIKTTETVNVPNDLCASYGSLNRHAQQGLMLLNASFIEPGYQGPLSCFLVNFSSKHIQLTPNGPIAKIIFYNLTAPPKNLLPCTLEGEEYEEKLSVMAKNFPKYFMDISGIELRSVDKASQKVNNSLILGGAFLAVLILWSTLEPLFSKLLLEKTGIYSNSQRIEDTKLLKDLENANLKTEIERLKTEIQKK